jgi:hypothetical protein
MLQCGVGVGGDIPKVISPRSDSPEPFCLVSNCYRKKEKEGKGLISQ